MIIDGNMNVSSDDENLEQMAKNSIMDNITSEEAVFNLDIFTTKTSRNETNHFHIYVDDNGKYKVEDSNFVADDLTPEEYGSLIHEYVHYIQHIQTLFGVNRTRLYARRGTDGGQNGRKSANIEVKSQKTAKMGTILSA